MNKEAKRADFVYKTLNGSYIIRKVVVKGISLNLAALVISNRGRIYEEIIKLRF